MQEKKGILQSNSKRPAHIISIQKDMGGDKLESLQTEQQQVKQIEGKFGEIKILKPTRDILVTDEDIHTLLARILLKRQKRITSGE